MGESRKMRPYRIAQDGRSAADGRSSAEDRGMIITLANGKGGSGKTTLAVLLAHALAESGKAVSVLDLDPQGTATNWLRESGSKVAMYDPARKYEAVFIDTPPR